MKLYQAILQCSTCGKHFKGEPMSNTEDAEQLARIDHRSSKGHWPDETSATIRDVEEKEVPPIGRTIAPLVDKTPIPNLDEKPRSPRSNRKR